MAAEYVDAAVDAAYGRGDHYEVDDGRGCRDAYFAEHADERASHAGQLVPWPYGEHHERGADVEHEDADEHAVDGLRHGPLHIGGLACRADHVIRAAKANATSTSA